MLPKNFGDLLRQFRKRKGLSGSDVANKGLSLSSSYISLLERSERGLSAKHPRGKPLTREQAWYLITKLGLRPPDCDILLEAAGHSKDRTREEELDIQREFTLHEVWIFACCILDPDPGGYEVVSQNILEKGVVYRYFTAEETYFRILLKKIEEKASPTQRNELFQRLECILLPDEMFITDFAIYNPGRTDMYCCGTKSVYGRANLFYTVHSSEATRLYQLLLGFRECLNAKIDISLQDARCIYPEDSKSFSKFKFLRRC